MRKTCLDGMRILVMEDEFLIALDVEQLCQDHGADEVVIVRNIDELGPAPLETEPFHAAIVDVMLGDESTLGFARMLKNKGVPFIFATAYSETEGMFDAVKGVEIVSKPYGGDTLLEALGRAIRRQDGIRSGGV